MWSGSKAWEAPPPLQPRCDEAGFEQASAHTSQQGERDLFGAEEAGFACTSCMGSRQLDERGSWLWQKFKLCFRGACSSLCISNCNAQKHRARNAVGEICG
jgi:hypothetical protein